MSNGAMDRRQMLTKAGMAAGAVAAGSVAMASPASADGEGGGSGLSGSYMVHRQSDTNPGDKSTAVVSFAAGNVMVIHDINPAGPPFTGTWAHQEKHGFRATVWTGFGGQGPNQPGPTARVKVRGHVHGGTLTATYQLTVFNPADNSVIQTDHGTVSGTPITA